MPTIYDVAKEAGVSIGTVSYVINGTKKVRPETVERVEQAMQKLNYLPSASAKALASGRTDVISLIYPNDVADFQMVLNSFARAIGDAMGESDYRLTLLPLPRDTEIQELEASVQARILDGALLLNTLLNDQRVAYLKQVGLPFVMLGRCLDNKHLYYVDADIEAAARLQVEHLTGLGHRSIAYVGFQPFTENISSVSYRLQSAFSRSLQEHGLPVDDRLFVRGCSPIETVNEVESLLKAPHAPTAISAADEAAVMCVLKTASRLGLKIPGDLAVIGYADSPLYPLLTPPITVVFDQIMELGRLAAEMLLVLLDGRKPENPQVLLAPHLVVRLSTVEQGS